MMFFKITRAAQINHPTLSLLTSSSSSSATLINVELKNSIGGQKMKKQFKQADWEEEDDDDDDDDWEWGEEEEEEEEDDDFEGDVEEEDKEVDWNTTD